MKINLVAFGDSKEAFVEKRFTDGINIIYSIDNNKGKTILFQGMMYALGNDPSFPSSFSFIDKTFITDIEISKGRYRFVRKKDMIVVVDQNKGVVVFCGSLGDLRNFLNTIGFSLPTIIKNFRKHLVYPALFYQMFFIGQDGRFTGNISKPGFYHKDDFFQVLFALSGISSPANEPIVPQEQIDAWKVQKKELQKELQILKTKNIQASFLSFESRRNQIESKMHELNSEKMISCEIRKEIDKELRRKARNESLLAEIKSLHRQDEVGDLVCAECGSKNIVFKGKEDFQFEVADEDAYGTVTRLVNERITNSMDEIERLEAELAEHTAKIRKLMEDPDVSMESLVFYKQKIQGSDNAEESLQDINSKLDSAEQQNQIIEEKNEKMRNLQEDLLMKMSTEMRNFYKEMDPNGNLEFDNLFSKGDNIYSGAEASEFFLSKFYVIGKDLLPDYPIIVDSFREGELSTIKEEFVLTKYRALNKQILFSATLKKQEGDKYKDMEGITAISYEQNVSSHMLSPKYLEEFLSLLPSSISFF